MSPFYFNLFLSLVAFVAAAPGPQLQLENTTLIGREVTLLEQEFFGGELAPSSRSSEIL